MDTDQTKPIPETHQTRTGCPWRYLDLKGQDRAIAILMDDGKEYGFFINHKPTVTGTWIVYDGMGRARPEFDLVLRDDNVPF